MKSILARRLAATLVLGASLASTSVMAVLVTLTPSSVSTTPGGLVLVDVRVSDLGVGNALGAFDLDVGYDPALVNFNTVVFGASLGDPASFQALTSVSTATPGVVGFTEVSLLTPAQLTVAQVGNFSIATLAFSGLGSGTAGFALLSSSTLSDAFGRSLPIGQATQISEPDSVFLFALGLGALAMMGRRPRPYARTTASS
jgi:hypothetical protein